MGRFDDRATGPRRGFGSMLRWKLWQPLTGRGERRVEDFCELDAIRPERADGTEPALAALGGPGAAACWIGHATWLLRVAGKTVAVDPIWSRSIGGVVRRLVEPGLALDDLPAIDIVAVTHDHRDHMDMATLARLAPDPLIVVGLGNGKRAERLGYRRVVELDWWESLVEGDLEITFVPARHWSMRTPWTRNDTLWGGYLFRGPEGVAYHAGDTAAGDHFAEIGRRAGVVDWAMLPIGGYEPRWFMQTQHIGPEEAGEAFVALAARHLLAMHWGTFRLTDEAVGEPPARLREWWTGRGLEPGRLHIPALGAAIDLSRLSD